MSVGNIDIRPQIHRDSRLTRKGDTQGGLIQSLARGIEVLRAFGPENDRMTIAEAARATGLTRAGARRILLTLEHLGYVRSDERHYYLTARVLELGHGFLAQPLWQVVRPALLSVSKQLNETASAGVLDGHEVVYTARVRSERVLQLELRAGARLPAFASSIGRMLLAMLPAGALNRYFATATFPAFTKCTVTQPDELRKRLDVIRAQGWCYIKDEIEMGICGIAVPLVDATGRTVCALNVSTRSDRVSLQTAKSTILPLLRETADSVRNELQAF